MRGLLQVLIWTVALLQHVSGLIYEFDLNSDTRHFFNVDEFGYSQQGIFELTITKFEVDGEYDPSRLAFAMIASDSEYIPQIEEGSTQCFHEDDGYQLTVPVDVYSKQWAIRAPGYYQLYFSNCDRVPVTLEATITQYNIYGNTRSFLPVGENSLPYWFVLICIAFAGELVVWLLWLYRSRQNTTVIHYLMAGVLMIKILTVFVEAFRYHSLEVKGKHDGWTTAFYVFSILKGFLFFSVVALIGTGWSYLRPFLTKRDKYIMASILVVQLLVNIAMVVVDEEIPGTAGWISWEDLLHLMDMLCCCLLLVPIVSSIRHLKSTANMEDHRNASKLARLKSFRSFYLLVVCYIYVTRIAIVLLQSTVSVQYEWVPIVFDEFAALGFYGMTGFLFRPMGQNPYTTLANEEDVDVDVASDEEFGLTTL